MIVFTCDSCKEINNVDGLVTTDTGEWVIQCTCGYRETITEENFD